VSPLHPTQINVKRGPGRSPGWGLSDLDAPDYRRFALGDSKGGPTSIPPARGNWVSRAHLLREATRGLKVLAILYLYSWNYVSLRTILCSRYNNGKHWHELRICDFESYAIALPRQRNVTLQIHLGEDEHQTQTEKEE